MRKISIALLVGVSASALSVAPAMAQSADADAAAGGIQEIIVTAQKREESAQKAAIAISVVSAENLVQAGITSPTDLGKVVPAVKVSQAASPYVPINIRGIANFALNAYSDPAAVVSYAGVPLSRPSGLFGNLYDLARVEVLKGPQGTLYGRNATSGALNILPAAPKLGEFGGNGLFEYGNYDFIHVSGAINAPLGEKAALRVAGDFIDRDGYYADGTSDQVSRSMRAQLRVEPDDRFAITLGADFSHQGGRGPGMSLLHGDTLPGTATPDPLVGQFVGDAWDGLNSAASCASHAVYYFNNPAICKNDSYQDSDFWGVNATIDWDVGVGTLTVLPAFRRSNLNYHVNNYPNLEEHQIHEQSSLEVRLSSNPSSDIKWVLGGFVFDENTDSDFLIRLDPSGPPTRQDIAASGTSYAAFGQVTVPLMDSFRVTGGIRYTNDKKEFDGQQTPAAGPIPPRQANRSRTDTAVTWKVGVEYDVAPNSLLYASVDRGYHSGGFFFTTAPRDTYEPEKITSYTIGSKNMLFNRRLQLNLEAFYYDYKDQQVSHFAVLPTGPGFVTDNAGNAKVKGVEADIRWLATETTNVFANIQYLNAKYKKFDYSTGFAPQKTSCPKLTPTPAPYLPAENVYNCAGNPMINAPKWSINAGIEQTFELANGAAVVANVGGQFQSFVWLAPFDYLAFHDQGSKFSADASLAYTAPGGKWSITGWVRNLTDETVSDFVTGTNTPAAGFAPGSVPVAVLRPPRTYGVRATVNF